MSDERDDAWASAVRAERVAALLGLALAGALLLVTGAALSFHFGPRAATSASEPIQVDEIVRGMVMRNLHRLGTRAIMVVAGLHATFLLVLRLSSRGVLRGARRARVAAVSLGAALVLLLAAVTFVPWDAVSGWMLTLGPRPAPLVGHEGPFAEEIGGSPRYDARALLTAGRLVGSAVERRIWILHGIVFPVLGAALLVLHLRWGKHAGAGRR